MFMKSRKRMEENEQRLSKIEQELAKLVRLAEEKGKTLSVLENPQKDVELAKLSEQNDQILRALRGQSDSFEDFLEEQSRVEELEAQLEEERKQSQKKLLRLAGLAMEKNDQLFQLKGQLSGSAELSQEAKEGWSRQFEMMEQMSQKSMSECQLSVFGQEGEAVDYDLVEVLHVVDTEDVEKKGRIYKVNSQGYMFEGKVLKKAVVEAYR